MSDSTVLSIAKYFHNKVFNQQDTINTIILRSNRPAGDFLNIELLDRTAREEKIAGIINDTYYNEYQGFSRKIKLECVKFFLENAE